MWTAKRWKVLDSARPLMNISYFLFVLKEKKIYDAILVVRDLGGSRGVLLLKNKK